MSEPIRPAATVVLWRKGGGEPELLMGQRGASAIFMPSKFVFPGGAVDAIDHQAPDLSDISQLCRSRLQALPVGADIPPSALTAAALRELAEETGLSLSPAVPFQQRLQFIFRAITPPGRPRRFDARFFLIDAQAIDGNAEDFSGASDELSHLHWIGINAARGLDLPFITEVVLAETAALLAGQVQPGVPFFDNSGNTPLFRRID